MKGISAKQGLSQMGWLSGKRSGGRIQRTLPPCPVAGRGPAHSGKHTRCHGQHDKSVKHGSRGGGSNRDTRGKISKIHEVKNSHFCTLGFCF